MSRVTIESLYSDFIIPRTNAREYGANYEQYVKLAEMEVVPRKMVEMIIEKCKEIQHDNNADYDYMECGKWCASDEIKDYAESLLKHFEEEKE